jgi:hypothetical protein
MRSLAKTKNSEELGPQSLDPLAGPEHRAYPELQARRDLSLILVPS